jgi:hypothetical protein
MEEHMKVFISWSGNRSKYVADSLRNWLPKVIQAVRPWMSDEDMSIGTRWAAEIAGELEQTKVGIICLTPENQHNPWVMFEAGALSKTIVHAYVCPYLIEMPPSQLSGPLAQFQAATANKEGTARVLQMLNKALDAFQIPSVELDEIFEVWWPRLEEQLKTIPVEANLQPVKRETSEVLEELVNNSREQLRREEIRLKSFQQRDEQMDTVLAKFETFFNAMTSASGDSLSASESFLQKSVQLPGRQDVPILEARQEPTIIDNPSPAISDMLKMAKDLQIEAQNVPDLATQQEATEIKNASQALSDLMKIMKNLQTESKQERELLLNETKDEDSVDSAKSNDGG